jgi:hypothetical protein
MAELTNTSVFDASDEDALRKITSERSRKRLVAFIGILLAFAALVFATYSSYS